jgi:hypothetical protein
MRSRCSVCVCVCGGEGVFLYPSLSLLGNGLAKIPLLLLGNGSVEIPLWLLGKASVETLPR